MNVCKFIYVQQLCIKCVVLVVKRILTFKIIGYGADLVITGVRN
jgi:hypothetical protein